MKQTGESTHEHSADETRQRRLVGMHLQSIEDNPLDAEDIAMFEMFERENWPHDKRRAYILERARSPSLVSAAE